MPGKGTPWTDAEIAIVREAKDRWDRASLLKLIGDLKTLNPSRSACSIKLCLLRERRGGDTVHPAIRARILERWTSYIKSYGGLTSVRPKDVLEAVNNGLVLGPRYRCSVRQFVVESQRACYMPSTADWRDLVQVNKKCPNCGEEKERSLFGYDPQSLDGLKRMCLKCRNQYVYDWMERSK